MEEKTAVKYSSAEVRILYPSYLLLSSSVAILVETRRTQNALH